ncbi:hypothetical protein KCU77_g3935, partial [Aureobasidium melanogenum]
MKFWFSLVLILGSLNKHIEPPASYVREDASTVELQALPFAQRQVRWWQTLLDMYLRDDGRTRDGELVTPDDPAATPTAAAVAASAPGGVYDPSLPIAPLHLWRDFSSPFVSTPINASGTPFPWTPSVADDGLSLAVRQAPSSSGAKDDGNEEKDDNDDEVEEEGNSQNRQQQESLMKEALVKPRYRNP